MYNLTVQASNCAGSIEERKTVYIPGMLCSNNSIHKPYLCSTESSPLQWNGAMCKTYSKTSLSAVYSSWQPIVSVNFLTRIYFGK